MICSECVYKLDLFFNFRQKSIETESLLVEMLKKLNECTMVKVGSTRNLQDSSELIYEQNLLTSEQLTESALLALGAPESLVEVAHSYIGTQFTHQTHLTHLTEVEPQEDVHSDKLPIIAIKNDLLNVKVLVF